MLLTETGIMPETNAGKLIQRAKKCYVTTLLILQVI
jgi:hypothetical protein